MELAFLFVGVALGVVGAVVVLRRPAPVAVERRLLSTLMHDLRTPLTSLQLTMGELAHHAGYADDERVTLGRAIEEVVALRSLLENLRLVAGVTGTREAVERTSVGLKEQVERLEYRYELMAKARGVTLELDAVAVSVVADPRLVELLLANLVELALRSDCGLVQVTLGSAGGQFSLTCRAAGGSLPPLVALADFLARKEGDRGKSSRTLALVGAAIICETFGWSLSRPADDALLVTGAAA